MVRYYALAGEAAPGVTGIQPVASPNRPVRQEIGALREEIARARKENETALAQRDAEIDRLKTATRTSKPTCNQSPEAADRG